MIATPRSKLLLVVMAAVTSIAFTFQPSAARAADGSADQSSSSNTDTVTIEGQKRDKLKRQINHFVSSVVVSYTNESLERWDTPICPLVAGLTKEQGEFVLARVSEIARTARVPLAGEHCPPNLYVVVADNPDELVKTWWDRNPTLLSTRNGIGYAKDFLHARGPVRVFYNAEFRTSTGARLSADTSVLSLSGVTLNFNARTGPEIGTRIAYGTVQTLGSVIIVVDKQRTTDINIRQLADYVAMVGLAQLRPDADTGMVPTILRLFRQADQPPAGLTAWDESFLHSLYGTDQRSVMQASAIKEGMLAQIGH